MLCGDAAGLVDPITGEGIAYAMQSGNLAALAAQRALKYNSPELAYRYYMLDYNKMSHPIAVANKLKYLIFPARANKLFVRVLPKTKSLPFAYFDLLAGEIDYDQYAKILRSKLWKRITGRR
jgi:flavin-dependent dehydrogenase